MTLGDKVHLLYQSSIDVVKNISYPSPYEMLNFSTRFIGYSIVGSIAGAVSGEIIDHLPYLSKALPEAAQILSSIRTETSGDTVYKLFYGNLDKVGAFAGLMIGVSMSRKDNKS